MASQFNRCLHTLISGPLAPLCISVLCFIFVTATHNSFMGRGAGLVTGLAHALYLTAHNSFTLYQNGASGRISTCTSSSFLNSGVHPYRLRFCLVEAFRHARITGGKRDLSGIIMSHFHSGDSFSSTVHHLKSNQ